MYNTARLVNSNFIRKLWVTFQRQACQLLSVKILSLNIKKEKDLNTVSFADLKEQLIEKCRNKCHQLGYCIRTLREKDDTNTSFEEAGVEQANLRS